jgi:hypothetical protein
VDLLFRNAASIITVAHPEVQFVMVGCGRNGGWLALAIARLIRILQESGMKVSALFSILITSKKRTYQLGCVDNAAARREMISALSSKKWETPPKFHAFFRSPRRWF